MVETVSIVGNELLFLYGRSIRVWHKIVEEVVDHVFWETGKATRCKSYNWRSNIEDFTHPCAKYITEMENNCLVILIQVLSIAIDTTSNSMMDVDCLVNLLAASFVKGP